MGPPDRIERKRRSSLRVTSKAGRGVFIREREPNRWGDPTDGRVAVRRLLGRRTCRQARSVYEREDRIGGRSRSMRARLFSPFAGTAESRQSGVRNARQRAQLSSEQLTEPKARSGWELDVAATSDRDRETEKERSPN